MIIDKTENLTIYERLLPNLRSGLQAIGSMGKDMETGKYEFEGGYFLVQEGETRPVDDGDYEVHRKYLDVQIILSGSEEVAWNDISELKTTEDYDSEKDKEMLSGASEHLFTVTEGMCWIAFPHDAHKACRDTGKRRMYKKIVMKLPLNENKAD